MDETIMSWVMDDARRGCHGYGDVSSEPDDESSSQQIQHGRRGDAVCMTRLDVTSH